MFTAAELSVIYSALRIAADHWDHLHQCEGNMKDGEPLTQLFSTKATEARELRSKVAEAFVSTKG